MLKQLAGCKLEPARDQVHPARPIVIDCARWCELLAEQRYGAREILLPVRLSPPHCPPPIPLVLFPFLLRGIFDRAGDSCGFTGAGLLLCLWRPTRPLSMNRIPF